MKNAQPMHNTSGQPFDRDTLIAEWSEHGIHLWCPRSGRLIMQFGLWCSEHIQRRVAAGESLTQATLNYWDASH